MRLILACFAFALLTVAGCSHREHSSCATPVKPAAEIFADEPANPAVGLCDPAPSFTPQAVAEHVRLVNPGAEVPIYAIDDEWMFIWFSGLPPTAYGQVIGVFRTEGPSPEVTTPSIYILGHWSQECEVAIHEYQHMLEYLVPDRRRELREAFRKLSSPTFRIGYQDLEPVLSTNGAPNPITLPFPPDDE